MPLADNYRGISTLNKLLFSRCYILVLPGDNWCPIILVITGDKGCLIILDITGDNECQRR
jgi:hypothetical protein